MSRFCNCVLSLLFCASISACEWRADVDIVGSLQPLEPEQFDGLPVSPPPESVIVSADRLELSASVDCSGPSINDELGREASGTLILENETFQIFASNCANDVIRPPEGVEVIESVSLYAAYRESEGVGEGSPVYGIMVLEIIENAADWDQDLASVAGQTLVYVALSTSFTLPQPETIVAIGKLGPPTFVGQQILVNAAEDLESLLGQNNSFTESILLGSAADLLLAAADDQFWSNGTTLKPNSGAVAYANVAAAISTIEIIADTTGDAALMMGLNEITSRVLDLMRSLAEDRIEAAIAGSGNAFIVSLAAQTLESGDVSRAQGNVSLATQQYATAWSLAGSASG